MSDIVQGHIIDSFDFLLSTEHINIFLTVWPQIRFMLHDYYMDGKEAYIQKSFHRSTKYFSIAKFSVIKRGTEL